jgi:hypothetical protein
MTGPMGMTGPAIDLSSLAVSSITATSARINVLNASTIGGFSPITFTDAANFVSSVTFTVPTTASTLQVSSIQGANLRIEGVPAAAPTLSNVLAYDTTTGEVKYQVAGSIDVPLRSTVVFIGCNAGEILQGDVAVAIGYLAGQSTQQSYTVAIGYQAGQLLQKLDAIAIGDQAGQIEQNGIGIGVSAANYKQGLNAIAVGAYAGQNNQGGSAFAMGFDAGFETQGPNAFAMGRDAGYYFQGSNAIAIGNAAGSNTQGASSIAIGVSAGQELQGLFAIAIGNQAGMSNQVGDSIAIGNQAGKITQQDDSVAIGAYAAESNQGAYAIAIGAYAGQNNQSSYSIVLNASGAALDTPVAGLFVNPVRSNAAIAGGFVHYDTATNELVYNDVGGSGGGSGFETLTASTLTVAQSTFGVAARFSTLNVSTLGGFSPINVVGDVIFSNPLTVSTINAQSIQAVNTNYTVSYTTVNSYSFSESLIATESGIITQYEVFTSTQHASGDIILTVISKNGIEHEGVYIIGTADSPSVVKWRTATLVYPLSVNAGDTITIAHTSLEAFRLYNAGCTTASASDAIIRFSTLNIPVQIRGDIQVSNSTIGAAANFTTLTTTQSTIGAAANFTTLRTTQSTIGAAANFTTLTTTQSTIGATARFNALDVNGAARATNLYINNGGSNDNLIGNLVIKNNANQDCFRFTATATDQSISYLQAASTMYITAIASGTPVMTIGTANTYSGRVGIGCNAPQTTLDVNGGASFQSNVNFKNVAANNVLVQSGQQQVLISNAASPYLYLQTLTTNPRINIGAYSNVTGMTLCLNEYGGNVGIGCNAPANLLDVNGVASKPGGGSWTSSSDERIKQNIVAADLTRCYSTVKALQLKYFEWNPDYYNETIIRDRHHIGFIAQEVKSLFPKAVTIIPQNMGLSSFHMLDVDQIFKAHFGATQKLIEKVEALEQQNSTLQGRIEILESRA